MDLDDPAADMTGFGVPRHVIANLEFRGHDGCSQLSQFYYALNCAGCDTCRSHAWSPAAQTALCDRDSKYHNAPFPINKRTRKGRSLIGATGVP
jgi:hypothetical protein